MKPLKLPYTVQFSRCKEYKLSGGNGGGETPVPIPNTEVKPSSADGTASVTMWESRSPPEAFLIVRYLPQVTSISKRATIPKARLNVPF